MNKYFVLFLVVFCNEVFSKTVEQNSIHKDSISFSKRNFIKGNDVFGTRVFIENRGQFDKSGKTSEKILFVYNSGCELIYFTSKGLIYELVRPPVISEEEREEKMEKGVDLEQNLEKYFVSMNWQGSAEGGISVEPSEQQGHYFTYGGPEYNSRTFKKLTYKNVYKNIDIEYTLPEEKSVGIKYSFLIHPGASPGDIKIVYSGDIKKIKLNKNGEAVVKTPVQDIIEHVPVSYYTDGEPLSSEFELKNNLLGFNFPENYKANKEFIIDPWVSTVTTLSTNNCAYDVDYDVNGNTFIYGGNFPGNGRCKVAKYDPSGNLQWTFSGLILNPVWNSGSIWSSNFKVEKATGKTFVGRNQGLPNVVRLDVNGNYDNFISNGSPSLGEVWNIEFKCNGDLVVFGGAGTSCELVSASTGSIYLVSTFSPGITGCCQDIVSTVVDEITGDTYVYYLGHMSLQNKINLINPTYTNSVWSAPSGFSTLLYLQNKSLYVGANAGSAVAFNALSINSNYLFYYDGLNLAAYNKNTGGIISSITVPGLVGRQQGGIASDNCDNIYIGGNGSVLCYNFNGTSFNALSPLAINANLANQYVYDIQLDKYSNTLYVAGSGFVASYSVSSCPNLNYCLCMQPILTVNTTSTNCANIGSSTVTALGMVAPLSYTWLPGLQTTSVVTGLSPGNYTVIVQSASCNITASAVTSFTTAGPGYNLNVSSTSITCANLGSATVGVTNMPGPFSYTWLPSAQTGSVATGLSPGTHTLLINSLACNYTFTNTTTFYPLVPLTGNLNNSSSITCNGANTGTASITNLAGGSGSQTYLWTNGISTYTTPSVSLLGAGVWIVTVTDALTGCQVVDAFLINQPPAMNLNIVSSTPTNCVGEAITFTASNSGGTPGYTYSWNPGPASPIYSVTQNAGGTYVYTVNSQDANSCNTTQTVSVDFINKPVITVSNVSICPLETATLSASGANTYTWSNNSNTFFIPVSPGVTTSYSVIGAALGCTSTASASVILKAIPSPVFSSNSPVCNGQTLSLSASGGTAYVWSGPQTFSSSLQNNSIIGANPNYSGVYNLTVTGVNSCTSSTSYSLTVYPTPTLSAIGSSVCVNGVMSLSATSFVGSTYAWIGPNGFVSNNQNVLVNSPLVSASGIYTVKATSAVGCTNVATCQVTVTSLPQVNLSSNSPLCYGTTLQFNGSNTIGGASYNWTGPNSFSSSLVSPFISTVNLSGTGIYTLLVTNGPCQNSNTTAVLVNPLPTPTISSNAPVCESKKLILSVSTPSNNIVSYTWSGPALFSSTAMVTYRDSMISNYSGQYIIAVMDANACSATTAVSVTVLPNPLLTTRSATVCLNDTAIINASGAVSYAWYNKWTNFSNTANAQIIKAVNPVGNPATYTVIGTAQNGCTTQATASVTTLKLPTPSVVIEPSIKQCLGSVFVFSGQGGNIYRWLGPANFQASGQTFSITATSSAYAGIYTLSVIDDKGCKGTTSSSIQVMELPGGDLNSNALSNCVPFCSDFKYTPSINTLSNVSQNWTIEKTLFTQSTFSYCFREPGNYFVKGVLTDLNGCVNTITTVVNAFPLPQANFIYTPKNPVENTDEVLLQNTSEGASSFNWYISTNQVYSTHQNASCLFKKEGVYAVALVVKNEFGCTDSVVKAITIDPDFVFFVPNAFTPNEDDKNEQFLPVMRGVKYYSIKIFNRWGQLLFESTDMNMGWNGSYNESPCEQGVYVWKVSLSTLNGKVKDYNGHVTLYR